MSSHESGVRSSQIFSADVVLVAGVGDSAALANLSPSSQLIGCVRKVAGGVAGILRSQIIPLNTPFVVASTCSIHLVSTVASDTSTYTVYWRNEIVSVDPSLITVAC
jgi:hypothetical protein